MARRCTPVARPVHQRHYQLLARVAAAINTSLEPDRVLSRVLREAVRLLKASSGSLALLNPHTQLLEIEVAIGLSAKARQLKLPIGRGVTGWVAKTGQPLRVPDVAADARYVAVRPRVRSELAVPLVVGEQLIGVLNVDSTRRNAFSEADETLLVALANQAAQVIHNSWLYQTVAIKARQLESLFAVAQSIIASLDLRDILQQVVRDACALMQTKVSSLMLLNASRDRLELAACHGAGPGYMRKPPLDVQDSLIGYVVRRAKPLQVYNVQQHDAYRQTELARQEGLVSLLSVPMIAGDTVIGALNVYTAQPYRFSNQDIRVLGALANLSAIAIEHARLHERIVAAEEQLRRQERLSTLGLLAAEVAHEIRNPLTAMKMLFHSLDLRFDAPDPRAHDVEIIAERMDHLNRIVDRLLSFARSTEPQFSTVNVNELLADVLLLLRHRLTQQKVEVRRALAEHLPAVRADRTQLEQLCLNLLLNATEAMPHGGTLTVSSAPAGDAQIVLSFRDTGPGLPPDKQRQIFEPFLTTKPHGAGLGLAIVQKIVTAHRGRLELDSAPGAGTTFRVYLPL